MHVKPFDYSIIWIKYAAFLQKQKQTGQPIA